MKLNERLPGTAAHEYAVAAADFIRRMLSRLAIEDGLTAIELAADLTDSLYEAHCKGIAEGVAAKKAFLDAQVASLDETRREAGAVASDYANCGRAPEAQQSEH